MAIYLPEGLPARSILEAEGFLPATSMRSRGWQSRPLEIAILNLMPNKAVTELQLTRLMAAAPFDVRITLVMPDGYQSHSTPAEHLARFYLSWTAVRHRRFDGLIVTGAPVETIPCEQVAYWRQLTSILDWTRDHVTRTYYICWGAMAALYHFHGIRTPVLPKKRFGVFEQTVREPGALCLRGFGGTFPVPVSRRAELTRENLPEGPLQILADSPESGLCLLAEPVRGALYMFNHLEYEATTLRDEFVRDLQAGHAIDPPLNYFPSDDPAAMPPNRWRPFGQLLVDNWLAEICDLVLPSRDSERSMDWLLAEPRATGDIDGFADFLIVAEEGTCSLPEILQRVEACGHRSLAAKVHREGAGLSLIELRLETISAEAAQRFARSLLRAPGVRQIAHRGCGGMERMHLSRGCSSPRVGPSLIPPVRPLIQSRPANEALH